MASLLYFDYDGTEIINAERVESYAHGLSWFTPVYNTYEIAELTQQAGASYLSPEEDLAPWFDPDETASYKFYGVYPLDVTGIEGSTRTTTPFENVADGGAPGRIRHGIRSVVFSVALVAEDDRGAEYGMRWLRRALLGGLNSKTLTTQIASGLPLTYFAFDPTFDQEQGQSEADQIIDQQRHLNKVTFSVGPTDPIKRKFPCGGQMWLTTFTATVGNPFEVGYTKPIFSNMPSAVTYAPGVTPGVGLGPTTYTEVSCESSIYDPFYDPNCPPFIEPPQPPSIPLGCYTLPATWQRFRATIPATEVSTWGQVVPTITVGSSVEQRGIRIRFYSDVDGDGDAGDEPCNFIGDMLISYMPLGSTLILDGVLEEVYVITSDGKRRRADSLVYGTDSKPFTWPSLQHGEGYVCVVDFDDTGGAVTRPSIALALTPRAI